MQGQRGTASRLGNAKTGITARVNGWDLGIMVSGHVDDDGHDTFMVYQTGGSNAVCNPTLIAIVKPGKVVVG